MILQRTIDTYVGMYDFAVTGGAVGSYDLQIPVPINTVVNEFAVISSIVPVGAAGAKVSFDVIEIDVNPFVVAVGGLGAATLITSWSGPTTTVQFIYPGVTSGALPFKTVHTFSIGMSISVHPLTAGQFQVFLRGTTYDF